MKGEMHKKRMTEKQENESELTEEMFKNAIEDLKKSKPEKYKFIINTGKDFRNALFQLFKVIWKEETKPDQWKLDTLLQIHKKGSKLKLDNFRFIHIKEDIPKLFGFIVTKEAKQKIIENMSKFQIGAVPGHRPQEHLFVMRSIVSLFEMINKPLILSLFDISKFFDKELLVDALDAVADAGVKGKIYRLLYLLNKDTRIKVKTNVGMTDEAETGENVAQGTVEGCLLSSSNVDKGLNEAFKNSSKEISYANIKLQPLLFKDDVMRASDTLESLKFGNNLIDHVMEEKLLSLNSYKSMFSMG